MPIFKQAIIVGLASFGQATYEKSYNGGMGSNGLTSARHDVFGVFANIQRVLMLPFPKINLFRTS
jgi:hypothetical protein